MAAACSFVETNRKVLFLGAFALYLIAAGVGIVVVRAEKFDDWYMHAGMWGVLGAYLLIITNGLSRGNKTGPIANLAIMGLLSGFWIWALTHRLEGGLWPIDGSFQQRPELPILWLPIVLLGLVWAFLLTMTIALWGVDGTSAAKPASAAIPAETAQPGAAVVPAPVESTPAPLPVADSAVEPPVEKE